MVEFSSNNVEFKNLEDGFPVIENMVHGSMSHGWSN